MIIALGRVYTRTEDHLGTWQVAACWHTLGTNLRDLRCCVFLLTP